MEANGIPSCPRCKDLEERVAALEAQLAKAMKNSGNSSKPPSSDLVKPPKPQPTGKKKRRRRGGQKGHPKHERPSFPPDAVDQTWDYFFARCPDCDGPVEPAPAPHRVLQQVEMIERPTVVVEHRGLACYCSRCRRTHHAPIDEKVREAGLVGPRLRTLVTYLKGACHASYSTIRKFIRDVVGLTISRGQLAKLIAQASDSLAGAYEELLEQLPKQERLNVDETGHKDDGKAMWTWCFRAQLFTLFKISPSRGSDVLLETLGKEFDGVLGCDYFSAYRKYMGECGILVQFCLAHLIRDIKFLAQHPDARNRSYGNRVLKAVRDLFSLIHRRETMSAERFALEMEDAGNELAGQATWRTPNTAEAQNLANRFHKHGDEYLRFITTPGIEPTNNLAEQAIRFVVIDRRITQGTRGQTGQRWSERIWTVMATCAQQGRSVFEFLRESIDAHLADQPGPSLITQPDTS